MIRQVRPEELNFVRANWARSYSSSDLALIHTPKDETHSKRCAHCGAHRIRTSRTRDGMTTFHAGAEYWAGQKRLIERLILSCNVSVLENPDGLLDGFVVRDRHTAVLHYVYVRQSARRQGVACRLVDDLTSKETVYTHRSRALDVSRLPKTWRFDLYALLSEAA